MTFEEALTAQIGDILVCGYTTTNYKADDEVILVERARDINEMPKDTGGWFYHGQLKNVLAQTFRISILKRKTRMKCQK